MPIISRFERWIRSKLSAIAARTPSSDGPFAAQSREEPEPYSLPASTISGHAVGAVALGRLEDRGFLTARAGGR